jgi:hypothetical protein
MPDLRDLSRLLRELVEPRPRVAQEPVPEASPRRACEWVKAGPLSMVEAAALVVSPRWLQDFLKTIPPCWLQCGRKKLFDDAALHAIREAMRCRIPSDN